jgi:hypothetical protein
MGASKLIDYQIFVSLLIAFAAWKLGDWKNWKLYYPTILYFIVGEFLYGLLCYNYQLWSFESPLIKKTFSEILIAFVFYPSTILIYLPHMPSGLKKRIPYILMWAAIFTVVEEVSLQLGFFSHEHGWNIWLSLLFNCVMFPILWVHYKKPLWACLALVVCAGVGLWMFGVPISSIK